MTILSVRHVTSYRYRHPVALGEHRMMFRPRDSYDQKLIEAHVEITPRPTDFRWIHDAFGNCVAIVDFATWASELRFESWIRLDHAPANTPDFQIEEEAKSYPFSYSPDELPDLLPSIQRRYADPDGQLERWAKRFLRHGRPTATGELLKTLTYGIKEGFAYCRRSEPGTHAPLATLNTGKDTCRDLSLLMMEAVRCLASRPVSSPAISTCRIGTKRPIWAEVRPTPMGLAKRPGAARL